MAYNAMLGGCALDYSRVALKYSWSESRIQNSWKQYLDFFKRVSHDSLATNEPVALSFRSNWNLEVFVLWREQNQRTRRKTLRARRRTNSKLNPGVGMSEYQTWVILVGEANTLTTVPCLLPACFVGMLCKLLLPVGSLNILEAIKKFPSFLHHSVVHILPNMASASKKQVRQVHKNKMAENSIVQRVDKGGHFNRISL